MRIFITVLAIALLILILGCIALAALAFKVAGEIMKEFEEWRG